MRNLIFSLILMAGLLSSCGSESANADVPTTPPPPSTPTMLGQRELPGYAISVHQLDPTATDAVTARILITADEHLPQPDLVSCWLGSAWDPAVATVPAARVAGSMDQYDVTLPIQSGSLTQDTAVWIRLSYSDGSVLEVGRDAFPLQ